MFGATALRRKREKERRERAARNSANAIYPYIQPFGKNILKTEQDCTFFKVNLTIQDV